MTMFWKRSITAVALIGSSIALSTAYAHSDEYLDSIASPHGGQQRMVGNYHLELVLKPGQMEIYVTDHANQPITTEGGKGRAIVMAGGQKNEIDLSPSGDNILTGMGDYAMDDAMKVIAVVNIPQEMKPIQARFTPMQKQLNPAMAAPAMGGQPMEGHSMAGHSM
jgi:hypothetical protein